jgi:glycosyltransferase involved in cell wall biosynthesis
MARRRTEEALRRPRGGRTTDESLERAAALEFDRRYGSPDLGPVTVVLPAYEEAASIGQVLDAVPRRACGLALASLVVVDGGCDGTEHVASAHGAFVVRTPVNRGQGAAYRLGYRVALDHGARYIVTVDADGQYDPGELERLLEPLLSGEADLVLGSRRLGHDHTTDRVRRLGVAVFAAAVRALTGTRVTDTSSGFRAMSADVARTVRLDQPQYQAAELLVSAICHGFRVVERPVTRRPRTAGRTKKGANLAYGLRYARVVLGTWLRDR